MPLVIIFTKIFAIALIIANSGQKRKGATIIDASDLIAPFADGTSSIIAFKFKPPILLNQSWFKRMDRTIEIIRLARKAARPAAAIAASTATIILANDNSHLYFLPRRAPTKAARPAKRANANEKIRLKKFILSSRP